MKKIVILLVLLIIGGNKGKSQVYKVSYEVRARLDKTDSSNVKVEKMLLWVNQDERSSYFVSENNQKMDSVLSLVNKGMISGVEALSELKSYPKTSFHFKVLKRRGEQGVEVRDRIDVKEYHYEEKLHIKWQILKDTLMIDGLACVKANTYYSGRNYIAWFAPSIPISDGPYKFSGLPGLIVRLYDEKEDYIFNLVGYEEARKGAWEMGDSSESFHVSKDEFIQRRKSFYNNPLPVLEAEGLVFDEKTKKRVVKKYRKRNNFIEIDE